ncbi:hypothetical protein [Caballeronia catudaia]|uniref:hypothetical protein n=1 Tax=Caballeronia catudaia TaxID=1777136 RepID=UPI0007727FFE|nr:hypothetical protein [Caballeronia catudaia]
MVNPPIFRAIAMSLIFRQVASVQIVEQMREIASVHLTSGNGAAVARVADAMRQRRHDRPGKRRRPRD